MWRRYEHRDQCPLLDELATRPAAVLARGQVLKHDRITTVVRVGDGERDWVVKRYNTKNAWHALRRQCRASRALNCWRAAGWLGAAGIDTPRPVAVQEERRWRLLRGRSWFIHEFIDADTLAARLRPDAPDAARLIAQAAAIVTRLAAAGIVHGDLKASNFLVAGERLFLIDLDATRRARGRRLAAGLQRDRERFLRNWAAQPELRRAFETELGG